MTATALTDQDPRQGKLVLARRAPPNGVPVELIRRQKTAAQAFALAVQSSGLEDSEIGEVLGIDAGYFSRIRNGRATLQADLVGPFCVLVGNNIYLDWLAYQVGCALVQIQTEAERRAIAAEERAAKAEEKARLLAEILAGKIAA